MLAAILAIAGGLVVTVDGPVRERSYWNYYDLVNQAEVAYLNGESARCFALYERAFSSVERPFTSDRVIAAEFALDARDTAMCLVHLRAAVDDGMTRAVAEHIPILKAALEDPRFAQLFAQRPLEPGWIDATLRDTVYARFYREQMVKEVMGRDPLLRARMQQITEENITEWGRYLEQGRFPSEQVIGLYTEQGFDDFLERSALPRFPDHGAPQIPGVVFGAPIPEDVDLCNKAALVDILHSPCSWITYRAELWTAVARGYLHPKDYCAMEEWLVRSRGNPNYLDTCTVERRPCYYNILFELRTTDPAMLAEVEQHRAERHLQSFAIDTRKRQMEKERGMVLFFGFMGWR